MLDEFLEDIKKLKDYRKTIEDLIDFGFLELHTYEAKDGNIYYYVKPTANDREYWLAQHIGAYIIEERNKIK